MVAATFACPSTHVHGHLPDQQEPQGDARVSVESLTVALVHNDGPAEVPETVIDVAHTKKPPS